MAAPPAAGIGPGALALAPLELQLPGPVPGPEPAPLPTPVDVVVGLGSSAVGAFLTTLLVGAVMVALAPDYTERTMAAVRDEPIGSFVYGFVSLVFVVLVTVLLVFTIVGIVVAIPFALLAFAVWAVGSAIAYLAVADRLVDRGPGGEWTKPLVVAGAISGGLALTGIGGIVAFCVGAAGFGAVLRDYLE